MYDALSNFRDAIRAAGLEPPDVIEPGTLYRFPGSGKRPSNRAGWCLLLDDGLGGCFGDWSTGLSETWQAERDKPCSRAERAAFARRAEEAKRQAETARRTRQADAARPLRSGTQQHPPPAIPFDVIDQIDQTSK